MDIYRNLSNYENLYSALKYSKKSQHVNNPPV